MKNQYDKLKTAERVYLLEKILPIEMELKEMELKEMAEFCKEKNEYGLSATLTETRTRLLVERHHLIGDGYDTPALSTAARKILAILSEDLIKRTV